ncbi:MAG: hypothetical protein JW941_12965 [Candidatus Coatesbacteria bacterium]|nr:hypothetical protein [Candidatus Coatesbacteria bacterium]
MNGLRRVLPFLLLFGLMAYVYLPTLKFELFADDFGFYGARASGQAISDNSLRVEKPALSPDEPTLFWPFSDLVWAAYFSLFGHNVMLYHLMAILVHTINTLLVFSLSRKLLGLERIWAFCAAFMFAFFWFNFEPAGWLAANEIAICTMFANACILVSSRYVRHGRLWPLIGLTVFGALSIAANEFGVVLPLLLALTWFLPYERPRPDGKKRMIIAVGILFALDVIYVSTRLFSGAKTALADNMVGKAVRTAWGLIGLLWGPVQFGFLAYLGAAFLLLLLIWKRTRVMTLWVLVALAPALLQAPEMRNAYLASVGLSGALAVAMKGLQERPLPAIARLSAIALITLGLGTYYAFLSQGGTHRPIIFAWPVLATAGIILFSRRRSLDASWFLPLVLLLLLLGGNMGLALDYPWPFRLGGKARAIAQSMIDVLPKGTGPISVAITTPDIRMDGELIPMGYVQAFAALIVGRDMSISWIEELLASDSKPDDGVGNSIRFLIRICARVLVQVGFRGSGIVR